MSEILYNENFLQLASSQRLFAFYGAGGKFQFGRPRTLSYEV